MLLLAVMPAMVEKADAVTSAFVSDFYGDSNLTGDSLMDAINFFSVFYIVSTTDPDGMPNSPFFSYSMFKNEDTYYLQMGLAENQSKQNLLDNGEGLALYVTTPSLEEGAEPYAVSDAFCCLL